LRYTPVVCATIWVAIVAWVPVRAAVTGGLAAADFVSPTVEPFVGSQLAVSSHNFSNGMTYANLSDGTDLINLTGTYGLGSEPQVTTGRGGAGDRYFGTGSAPTTFELAFPAGVLQFGFFGAEASSAGGFRGSNAQMSLEFYDLADQLLGTGNVTTGGTFAWDQFHGFSSDVLIGSIVFRDAGHMVLDDIHFSALPEPIGAACLAPAFIAVISRRRR
jgi:hypothetical protein